MCPGYFISTTSKLVYNNHCENSKNLIFTDSGMFVEILTILDIMENCNNWQNWEGITLLDVILSFHLYQ